MNIVAAFLADASNVREGTLSVLSGFLNQFRHSEFPARFGASLVIVAESEERMSEGPSYDAPLSFTIRNTETGEELVAGNGEIQVTQETGRSSYTPITIDLHELMLPSPGKYEVTAKIGADTKLIHFYVDQI